MLRIDLAGLEDAAELAVLISGFRAWLGAERPREAELRSFLPGVLADAASEFRIAREDGRAVAYTYLRYHDSPWALGPVAHLEDLFVVGSARGRGLGRTLLEDALAAARARGARAVGLHTNENNERAQALYRALGFAPETEERWDGGREMHWAVRLDESAPD